MIGHEECVEFRSFELLRETRQMGEIEIGVRKGAGVTPCARVEADGPHKGAEMQFAIICHRVSLSCRCFGADGSLSHPLAAEFDRLGDYLELMSVRMGERLRYTLDLPDDLRDTPVPPLLLQPLVENSIRHGLEPQVEGGEIAVRARKEADQLVIEVSDTGVGLDAAPPQPSNDGGFGLEQVRERLATVYGEQGRLSLRPAVTGGGTRVTLHLPLPA